MLNFTNGTKSQVFNLNAQDWYNVTTNVAVQGFGRVRLGQGTFSTENPGWNNPNIYQTTIDLAVLGLNRTVASISITNPAVGGSRTTAILGSAGLPCRLPWRLPSIQSPRRTPSRPCRSLSPLPRWARRRWVINGTRQSRQRHAALRQTSTNLVLSSIQLTDAGNYYAVVTNSSSSATSSVATLTVYRAPQIVQQPTPAASTRVVGKSISYSVIANAAAPVSYFWRTNG